MYDTADRLMAKYRKQGLEEIVQITTFEQQQHQNQPRHDSPLRPATPKTPAAQTTAPPPCYTHAPFAAATATHHKPSRKLERFVSCTPEKGESAATRRPERLSSPSPRTADSRVGGQMPGEDSWDWYMRSILAMPQVPVPASHSATTRPDRMEGSRTRTTTLNRK